MVPKPVTMGAIGKLAVMATLALTASDAVVRQARAELQPLAV